MKKIFIDTIQIVFMFKFFKKRSEDDLVADAFFFYKEIKKLEKDLIELSNLKKRMDKGEFLKEKNLIEKFEEFKIQVFKRLFQRANEILKLAKEYESMINKGKKFETFNQQKIASLRVALSEILSNPQIDYKFLEEEKAGKALEMLRESEEKLKKVNY